MTFISEGEWLVSSDRLTRQVYTAHSDLRAGAEAVLGCRRSEEPEHSSQEWTGLTDGPWAARKHAILVFLPTDDVQLPCCCRVRSPLQTWYRNRL
jgi:hypothetical protein